MADPTQLTDFLKGKDVVSCTIQAIVVDAAGVVALSGSPFSVRGKLESCEIDSDPEKEDIAPVTSVTKNMLILREGTTCNLATILGNRAANALNYLWANFDFFKVVLVTGIQAGLAGGSQIGSATFTTYETFSIYGSRGRYNTGIKARGKNVAALTIDPIDFSGTNFSQAQLVQVGTPA